MTDFEIYSGEDFALVMSAVEDDCDNPVALTDYDITAQLCTTAVGDQLIASTSESGEIVIERRGPSDLAINVSNKLTTRLSEGEVTLSVMLTHKQTGAQIIAETKTINIKRSKLVTV